MSFERHVTSIAHDVHVARSGNVAARQGPIKYAPEISNPSQRRGFPGAHDNDATAHLETHRDHHDKPHLASSPKIAHAIALILSVNCASFRVTRRHIVVGASCKPNARRPTRGRVSFFMGMAGSAQPPLPRPEPFSPPPLHLPRSDPFPISISSSPCVHHDLVNRQILFHNRWTENSVSTTARAVALSRLASETSSSNLRIAPQRSSVPERKQTRLFMAHHIWNAAQPWPPRHVGCKRVENASCPNLPSTNSWQTRQTPACIDAPAGETSEQHRASNPSCSAVPANLPSVRRRDYHEPRIRSARMTSGTPNNVA